MKRNHSLWKKTQKNIAYSDHYHAGYGEIELSRIIDGEWQRYFGFYQAPRDYPGVEGGVFGGASYTYYDESFEIVDEDEMEWPEEVDARRLGESEHFIVVELYTLDLSNVYTWREAAPLISDFFDAYDGNADDVWEELKPEPVDSSWASVYIEYLSTFTQQNFWVCPEKELLTKEEKSEIIRRIV